MENNLKTYTLDELDADKYFEAIDYLIQCFGGNEETVREITKDLNIEFIVDEMEETLRWVNIK